ncbi:MAG: hypothetical protein OEX02_04120 [Cyclobacteriaceae bacterium]|nr:hypothetical protein [Cyclobacteriaceae bacterium]
MTREEHLQFCKKCLNRKMDINLGFVCSMTSQQANFEMECPDYSLDSAVKDISINREDGLQREEIALKLPLDVIEKLRMEQNLLMGVIAALGVGLVGAVLWGAITVVTEFQIGIMAVAVGAGVGFGMQMFGKGIDQLFGVLGAVIALFSCVLGNVFSIVGFIANAEGLEYMETLMMIDFNYMPALLAETFSLMDLLFYGFALYEGYKFSFRQVTQQDLAGL